MSCSPRSPANSSKPSSPKARLEHCGRRLNLHQAGLGFLLIGRRTNRANHLVNVGQREQQAFDRMLTLPSLAEQMLSAAANDGLTVT